ncbi:MAG TPA: diguanylate cyclase [Bryobacteraceae bacterium]
MSKLLTGLTPPRQQTATDTMADLREEIARLERERADLEVALLTSNEHGDLLEDYLYCMSTRLAAEVRERQIAEEKLHRLVDAVTRERGDLEILVQILVDQGDKAAEEGAKARVDSLTQIANRRRFDECISKEWARHRCSQHPLSLLIGDVDYSKFFNDHYGHQAGDECLIRIAKELSHSIRSSGDLVARYGGEEFGIVLPDTDQKGAVAVAERMLSAVVRAGIPHQASPVSKIVTLSIGVGCAIPRPEGDSDPRPLIEEADRFLYLAKRSGRNRVGHTTGASL